MNVPFNSDYKHIVKFNSTSAQETAFKNRANNGGHHYTNLNIIVKNNAFNLQGRWDKFNEYNYMMWRYKDDYGTSNDHTSKWYYSFIDDVKYNTRLGTIIYHTIDVWQTYHIGAYYHKSYIERAHISVNDDKIGKWIAPEPIGFGADFETLNNFIKSGSGGITISSALTPELYIETLSLPKTYPITFINSNYTTLFSDFKYGGFTNPYGLAFEDFESGYYRIKPIYDGTLSDNEPYINRLLQLWTYPDARMIWELNNMGTLTIGDAKDAVLQVNTHLSDIFRFILLPKFVSSNAHTSSVIVTFKDLNNTTTNVGEALGGVENIESDIYECNINYTNLGCYIIENGTEKYYKPTNNKLFTSLARAYKIVNFNGLSIPLKPESFESYGKTSGDGRLTKVEIQMSMNSYGNILHTDILRYNDYNNKYFDIPYDFSLLFGLNSNVGVAQATKLSGYNIAKENAEMQYYSKAIGLISGVSGNANAIGNKYSDYGSGDVSAYTPVLSTVGAVASTGSGALSIVGNQKQTDFDLSIQHANAYNSQTMSLGNRSGDFINLENIPFYLVECNPTYQECKLIDDFLSVYGYSIMDYGTISDYLSTRSVWNYIKTKDCVINIDAPTVDTVAFNNIFNSGTTVWHDLNNVGNYNLKNT